MVEQVLSGLTRSADLRILIVRHMPDGFTERFAERLDTRSEYSVTEASDGDRIADGETLVAPGGKHMLVSNYVGSRVRVRLTDDPPVNSVRPAVDVTMSSVSEVIDDPIIGVILTGMDGDGADGITAIIAQDEATSAVVGKPTRAIGISSVDDVLPISSVSTGILEATRAGDNQSQTDGRDRETGT